MIKKKTKWIIFRAALTIGIFLFAANILFGQQLIQKEITNKNNARTWSKFFVEPIETCYITMFDGVRFQVTSYDATKVQQTYSEIKLGLEHEGYSIKDIITVIHNHFAPPYFSLVDKRTYRYLLADGFTGNFLLFTTGSQRLFELKVKE